MAIALALPGRSGRAAPVMQACTVATTPLAFGAYNPRSPVDLIVAGTISFNCTLAQPITITLDRGTGPHFNVRGLTNGRSFILYNVYLDPTATRLWGDGSAGTQFYSNMTPPHALVTVPFYGRIPTAQSNLTAGLYHDSIIVRINY